MAYQVLARKYRPMKFDEVVGQAPVVRTLQNAILQDRLAHAYLFAGPRGTGKTSIARILAKALNCPKAKDGDPCDKCEVCRGISAGEDIDVLEIDGASNNGVEEVRSLREAARYAPSRSPRKIYIIDEVHMLSTAAFNALLKTLEEPPPHVLFFFATTDPQKLPATIHSRCQRFNFHRIPATEIVGALRETCTREGVSVEEAGLWAMARRAGGSLRDALSLLDQSISYGGGSVTEATVREMLGLLESGEVLSVILQLRDGETADALRALDSLLREGADLGDFLGQMVQMVRDLLILHITPEGVSLIERSPEESGRLASEAREFTLDTLLHYMALLQETRAQIRKDSLPRIRVEVAMVELSRLPRLASLDEMVARLSPGSGGGGGSGVPGAEESAPGAAERSPGASGRAPGPSRGAPGTTGGTPGAGEVSADPGEGIPGTGRGPAASTPGPLPTDAAAMWKEAVRKLQDEKPTLVSIMELMRPVSLEEGVLTVAYPVDSRAMIEQALADGARKKAIEEALTATGGGAIAIRTVPGEAQAGPESAEDHPWIKAAKEILGGAATKEKEERQ